MYSREILTPGPEETGKAGVGVGVGVAGGQRAGGKAGVHQGKVWSQVLGDALHRHS